MVLTMLFDIMEPERFQTMPKERRLAYLDQIDRGRTSLDPRKNPYWRARSFLCLVSEIEQDPDIKTRATGIYEQLVKG